MAYLAWDYDIHILDILLKCHILKIRDLILPLAHLGNLGG